MSAQNALLPAFICLKENGVVTIHAVDAHFSVRSSRHSIPNAPSLRIEHKCDSEQYRVLR